MLNLILSLNLISIFSGQFISIIFVIVGLYTMRKYKFVDFKIDIYLKILLLLIGWMLVNSCFFSIDSTKSFITSLKFISLSLVGYVAAKSNRNQAIKESNNILSIYLLILFNIIIVIEHKFNYPITNYLQTSLTLRRKIAEPTDRISALFLMIVPYLYSKLFARNIHFIILVLITAVNFICHPMDTAKLAFLSAGLFVILYKWIGAIFLKIYFALLTFSLLSMPWLMKFIFSLNKIQQIILKLPASWEHRTRIWKKSIELIEKNSLTGYGVNSSAVIDPVIPLHPHNMFLQIWLELGMIGAYIFSMLFVIIYLKIANSDRRLQLFASFHVFMIFELISFGMWQSWFVASMYLTLIIYNKKL